MPELPREVPGTTAWERAVNLTGMLAEAGVQQVVLEERDQRRELRARAVDLPGEIEELLRAGGGVLVASGVRYRITSEAIRRET